MKTILFALLCVAGCESEHKPATARAPTASPTARATSVLRPMIRRPITMPIVQVPRTPTLEEEIDEYLDRMHTDLDETRERLNHVKDR